MTTMPPETKDALIWAEQQTYTDFGGYTHEITWDTSDMQPLVDKVCEYFAEHNIKYGTFDYYDVRPIIDEILAEQVPEEPIIEESNPA